ncbi:MAG: flagellar hook-associated protein [Pseudomonadota bacterium]|jgi:flagellar hook-associated protein 1 FlgK
MASLMSLGSSALYASYASLQATSNNIANANTDGYSRQTARLSTTSGQQSGAGFFGRGVAVQTVARDHDELLTREVANSGSLAAMDAARSSQLQRLEEVFQMGEKGLGYSADALFNAFGDVASQPSDASARQVVLSKATELVQRFNAAGSAIESLQAGVTLELKAAVQPINDMAQRVATLNSTIVSALGSGHDPNDLLDQRDELVRQISASIQVTTVESADGSMSVFLGGGQRLVQGSEVSQVVALQDPHDPSIVRVGVSDSGGVRMLPDDMITGGTVAGLLRFQNEDLVDARNMLGQMAVGIANALNTQQGLGTDTAGAAGQPIFEVDAPRVMPLQSGVTLSISDPALVKASSYELKFNAQLSAPRQYTLTRQPEGSAVKAADGQNAWPAADGSWPDGLTVNTSSWSPANGDSVLLQPLALAASTIKVRSGIQPGDIAAANASGANGNANALLALRSAKIVGGENTTDAYASILANIGVRVQNATSLATQSASVASAATARNSSATEVNLDDEAARLIQFQQSYQAAAKVLQTAQSLFDTLLQIAR